MKHFITSFAVAAAAVFSVHSAEIIRDTVNAYPINQKGYANNKIEFRMRAGLPYDFNKMPFEKTTAYVSYDKDNLYISAVMIDSDVVDESTENKVPFARVSDSLTLIIKPTKDTFYWEFSVSPKGHWTATYNISTGRQIAGTESNCGDIKVKSTVDGILNDTAKRDKTWSVDITIPLAEFRKRGLKFDNSEKWLMMLSRYNYSAFLTNREESSFPQTVLNRYDAARFANLVLK